jgi:hypothetical protein
VLLGHDLLGPYQLTIDLRQRVLQLRADGHPPGAIDEAAESRDSAGSGPRRKGLK